MIENKWISPKIVTKFGLSVTVLVLIAACSSKQVLNESQVEVPAEYTDEVTDVGSPYVDQTEVPAFQEDEMERVAQTEHNVKSKVEKKKKKKKSKKARKSALLKKKKKKVKYAEKSVEKTSKSESNNDLETSLAAMGSVGGDLPPPPSATGEDVGAALEMHAPVVLDQPVVAETDLLTTLLDHWYYALGVITLSIAFWFALGRKTTRKGKRRLVFN